MTQSAKRFFWMICGFLALGLGIAGVILPLLPHTVFLLIAAFCFSRSSERLHNWLINHKHLGPPIKDWNDHGAIPTGAKILATLMMGGALASAFLLHAPQPVVIAQLVILPLVGLFIWTRPNGPRGKDLSKPDQTGV
ncbi:YbaN family protein [Hirschia maritima]|uniref:YbaN family protein n=1 Tax=Hirschia maritima TaxID=1121961 RepID=UPI0003606EAC|nr:YbaN family protein [Hirschia maritima]